MIDPIPFFSGSYILPRTIIGAAFPISKKGLINLKKLTKQIISIALGAVTAASCGTMAFAADKTLNQDTPSGSSTVEYSEKSTYTATIPEYIHPAELGEQNTSAYSISIDKAVIATGETVSASVSYDGMLETGDGAKLPYTLYSDAGAIVSGSKIIEKSAGSEDVATFSFGAALNERARYSGNYSDTATFSFSVKSNITEYTLDEINANEHLYAIGKTKPEYVVAKFNEDYTEVEISKNGNNSDGLMKDGDFVTNTKHAATLKTATILTGVTNIGKFAFRLCPSLMNITIPNSVTTIGTQAFYACTKLTNVTIPNSVISIDEGAFSECSLLTEVNIPDSITKISNETFFDCSNLVDIVIPDSVTTIGSKAFYNCGFESVSISKNVNYINMEAFTSPKLEKFIVDEANPNYYSRDGVLFEKPGSPYLLGSLKSYPANKPGSEYTVPADVDIGAYAFENCKQLTKITISEPKSELAIKSGVTIGREAFTDCSNLISVIIPDNVSYIGDYSFNRCSSLIDITIPKGITTSNNTFVGRSAFLDCSSIENITIPDGITKILPYTFGRCSNLTGITIPASVTNIATDAFKDCNLLTTVYGTAGSYAETWAKNNGYTFIAQ